MHGQAPQGWEDVFGDGRSVHEHGTRIALASPANVVLTRITPDVLKALMRSVLVSPVGIAVPTSLPPGDRRDAAPCFLHADVRGDGLAKECVAASDAHRPPVVFPQDCYFGVFGGRVDGYLLFGAVMPFARLTTAW